jgi:ribosomal protein S18 acetylase RimI-like enzyme
MIIRRMKEEEKESASRYIKTYFGSYDYYNYNYVNQTDSIYFLVINEEEEIAGLVDAYPTDDFFSYPEGYEICDIIINQEYRGTGLSVKLLSTILAAIPETSPVYLCAWGTYEKGIPVTHVKKAVEACGFLFEKRIPDYYKNNGDCEECVNHGKNCSCYMDIYIRPVEKNEP